MKLKTTAQLRRTAICIASAIAIAVPGLSSAGFGDRAKARIQTVRTNTGVVITNVQRSRPLANKIDELKAPATEILETVEELQVLEQLNDTIDLMKQIQVDYRYFSGGQGCAAICADFRSSLKTIFYNFASLITEIPALDNESGLIENIERVSDLIDYMPPRALYLMWQAMSAKLSDLEAMADEIRQTLDSLPPLMDLSTFGPNTMSTSLDTGNTSDMGEGGFCEWVKDENKPAIELIQARLEMFGWRVEKAEGLIPDVEVKAEGGGEAGAAVANVTAAAGVGMKPTDGVKMALKIIAYVPQRLNWAIKLNILRAKVVCRHTEQQS